MSRAIQVPEEELLAWDRDQAAQVQGVGEAMRITWEDDERKALAVLSEFGNVYRLAERIEKLNKDHENCSSERMGLRMNGMELKIERMGRDVAQIVAEMEAIKDALGKLGIQFVVVNKEESRGEDTRHREL